MKRFKFSFGSKNINLKESGPGNRAALISKPWPHANINDGKSVNKVGLSYCKLSTTVTLVAMFCCCSVMAQNKIKGKPWHLSKKEFLSNHSHSDRDSALIITTFNARRINFATMVPLFIPPYLGITLIGKGMGSIISTRSIFFTRSRKDLLQLLNGEKVLSKRRAKIVSRWLKRRQNRKVKTRIAHKTPQAATFPSSL